MKQTTLLALVAFGLMFATVNAEAQGVGTSGEIRGAVTDSSGAVVPNATVTATNPANGIQRTATTGSDGRYRLIALPPSSYDLSVKMPGFKTELRKALTVTVGGTTVADFALQVAAANETVEVTTEPPVVEVQRGSQADTITEKYIYELPIDRRDYLTFTLLMPGVSNSTVIADNADYRVKQTPQSGLSFYGSNGRGNNVTVEGGETNDDSGGVRLNVSQDAVQEFQINRSNYSAELGSASGASVNIVTKSGTNRVHGTVFGFFRNDAMDAADPFAISSALAPNPSFSNFNTNSVGQHVKNSLNRQQFGGTIGFPIRKDKTFLFLSYEGLNSDAIDAVPLMTNSSIFNPTLGQQNIIAGLAAEGGTPVPCISNFPAGPPTILPASVCAFGLNSILSINPKPGPNPFVSPFQAASDPFIVNQFENNSGLFPFPTQEHQGYARLDHRFNDNNTASMRYTVAHLDETDPDVQALTAISRGTSLLNWDSTLQGSWFRQFSPNTINEARMQWVVDEFNVTTNDPGGPGLDVQGYGFFGRGIFLPSYTRSRRYEFADNLSMVRGHHQWKLGFYELIRGNKTTSDTFFSGRFEFLQLPGILVSACLEVPAACGLPANTPSAPISTLQSWSLGLPAFFEQGFGNPTYADNRPYTAAYIQDSWQIRHNFTLNYGLRYELDSQYGPLSTYTKDFAPRLSFAWDPFSDGKTVVRAGYGIFYSPIYAQIPNVVQTLGNINNTRQIANSLVTINGLPTNPAVNSAAIFQVLFSQGKILCGTPPAGANACITPADLAALGLTISNTGPLPPGTVLFTGQPDYRPPMAQQASLGIERQIGTGLTLSANYIYVHTTHLPWAVDLNLLPGAPVVTGFGANALPTNGLPFQNWGAPACVATPALCFADPTHTILQNNMYASIAGAVYHGGILELKEQMNKRLLLNLSYTYSKAIDDSTDFNSDYAAFNEVALSQERALSDFDQRHKFVASAVITSPWDHNRFLGGFQLSPIISYNSGHPFNLLSGADINGDNHFTNDRPPGAPRNSGIGPNFFTWDMRLSRNIKVSEKASLQLLAEGFNIANRVNYTTVNNILGNDSPACPVSGVNSGAAFGPPFNVTGSNIGPSCSLGFTSAAPMREVQLGIRLTF